jgi:acetylornithine deacetylase/succinyl-diaminopimelate desuccinylase-like protein
MIRTMLPVALLVLGLGALEAGRAHAAETENLWIHIHVRDAQEGRVSINLPISVVEKMANVIPADTRGNGRLRLNDEEVTVAKLREIWAELRKNPEATFITVDEADSKVRVAKKGGNLIVRAQDKNGREEEVEMNIPGSVVDALLSAPGEQLNVGAALKALARHGQGEIVTVTGDGETVRIWIDNSSESRAR